LLIIKKEIPEKLQNFGFKQYSDLDRVHEIIQGILKGDGTGGEQENNEKLERLLSQVKFAKIDGFVPTPRSFVEKLLKIADIQEGETILEPSAGIGSMAEVIKEMYPDNDLSVIEINYSLREILKLKGLPVVSSDFLEYRTKHDVIIMNPPFENMADIKHITHAFSLLNEGGRLVAIASATAYDPNSIYKAKKEFAQLVDTYGYLEGNYDNVFSKGFVQTDVRVSVIVLEKGSQKPKTTQKTQSSSASSTSSTTSSNTSNNMSKEKEDIQLQIDGLQIALEVAEINEVDGILLLIEGLEIALEVL